MVVPCSPPRFRFFACLPPFPVVSFLFDPWAAFEDDACAERGTMGSSVGSYDVYHLVLIKLGVNNVKRQASDSTRMIRDETRG